MLERAAELKAARAEVAGLDSSYRSIKKAILNPDRFCELWTEES